MSSAFASSTNCTVVLRTQSSLKNSTVPSSMVDCPSSASTSLPTLLSSFSLTVAPCSSKKALVRESWRASTSSACRWDKHANPQKKMWEG
jgi:hypothetical protein